MTDQHRPLTDAQARRLLARAVELDAQLGSGVTLPELRRAALEAGISAHAFDAAVAVVADERAPVTVPTTPLPTTPLPTTPLPTIPLRTALGRALGRNLLAAGGFAVLLGAVAIGTRWLGAAPPLITLGTLLAMLGGIRVAHRLEGRLVRDGLVALGAGQAVVFLFQLGGVPVLQGNVLNWGTLFTGILATSAMRLLQRDGVTPPLLRRVVDRAVAVVRAPFARRISDAHEAVRAGVTIPLVASRPV